MLAAKILFIFLGLPGVALAAYLAKFAAELFADAQRREISLLRTRGATPAQITGDYWRWPPCCWRLAVRRSVWSLASWCCWSAAGAQVASALNPFAPGFDWGLFGTSAAIAFGAGLVLTFLAAFLPTFGALRREITQERRIARRSGSAAVLEARLPRPALHRSPQ